MNFKKFSAFCGIIAPILLFLTVVILGFLNPGYSHTIEGLSGLGAFAEPNALIMNFIGFFIVGILIIIFSFGLDKEINQNRGLKTGIIFLVLSGFFWMLVGFFPVGISEFFSKVHSLSALASFLFGGIGIVIISIKFKKDSYWGKYFIYSFISGLITILSVFAGRLNIYGGLRQRIFLVVFFLWIELTAIKLFKKD